MAFRMNFNVRACFLAFPALTCIFGIDRNRGKTFFWSVKHCSLITGNSRNNASNMDCVKFDIILLVHVMTIIIAEK